MTRKMPKLLGILAYALLAVITTTYLVLASIARDQFSVSALLLLLGLGAVALMLIVKAIREKYQNGA